MGQGDLSRPGHAVPGARLRHGCALRAQLHSRLAPAWLDHVAFIQGWAPPARKQGFTWCERLWLDEPAAVTVVTAAGPDVNYSIVRAGKSRSWSYPKGEKAMSKSKPQSKSKPVNKGTRISSADALAKGAGTS